MGDAVIINYQLLLHQKKIVQKKKRKTEKPCFYRDF